MTEVRSEGESLGEALPDEQPPGEVLGDEQSPGEALDDERPLGEVLPDGRSTRDLRPDDQPASDLRPDDRPTHEDAPPREVRQRSEWEIRWRQARSAPPPVVRAVLANVLVAATGGIVLLLSDWLASGDVLPPFLLELGPLIYVVVVIISGSLFTYLWVELPTGVPGEKRRSPWAAVLGFFASIPIVYLALVVIFEILRPLLPG